MFFNEKNDLLYCYDISLENFSESTFFTFFPQSPRRPTTVPPFKAVPRGLQRRQDAEERQRLPRRCTTDPRSWFVGPWGTVRYLGFRVNDYKYIYIYSVYI